MSITSGGIVYVDGDVSSVGSSILHNGTLDFTGNWYNTDTGKVFTQGSTGWVNMVGGLQFIEGDTTDFPNLSLQGTDKKELRASAMVQDTLDLQDKELMLNGNLMYLLSNASESLERTSGYVTTDNDTAGKLVRAVTAGVYYLYPLGGGEPFRYRPLNVNPSGDGMIGAGFQNYDPSYDGYDRSKIFGDFNNVNRRFYHNIGWINGSGLIDVGIAYNSEEDSIFNAVAGWGINTGWRLEQNYQNTAELGEGTDQLMEFSLNADGIQPVALVHFIDNANLFIVSAFTPNGDGRNDYFVINGLENYTYNELRIFNRWGQMIFSAVDYQNNWGGNSNLDVGTYMYWLKVTDALGHDHIRKGDVTLLR